MFYRASEERNVLLSIKRRKANWIGYILHSNCSLRYFIESKIDGKIEVEGRRGRMRKHILDYMKEAGGYWKMKRGSTRSQFMLNSLWKRLWTCRKTVHGMNCVKLV